MKFNSNQIYLWFNEIYYFDNSDYYENFQEKRTYYAKLFNNYRHVDEQLLYELRRWNMIDMTLSKYNDILRLK